MTTARLKTPTVGVWQYWPDEPIDERWVANCTEQRGRELFLVRHSGKQLIQPGEWLIRNLDGDPTWISNADFWTTYEIARP
jgi:hypothetical protein